MLAQYRKLSRGEIVKSGGAIWVSVFLFWGVLAGPGKVVEEHEVKAEEAPRKTFAELVDSYRHEFPGAFEAALAAGRITPKLLQAVEEKPGTEEANLALKLTAEIAHVAGDKEGARELLLQVCVGEAPAPEKARAAFELGLGYLLEERYSWAEQQFNIISILDPESPWLTPASRLAPYFAMSRTKMLPSFEAEFSLPDKAPLRVTGEELRGRYAIIQFWNSSLQNGSTLMTDLVWVNNALKAREGVGAVLLGVNLDLREDPFREALEDWEISWPQLHDGRGFDGELVRSFGIPRVPHLVGVNPEGKVIYLGGSLAQLRKSLSEN